MIDALVGQIATLAELRMRSSLNGWASGLPLDEVAFLNRLTAWYRSVPFCRIGASPSIAVHTHISSLHRIGHGSRRSADRFGSDLAVTFRLSVRGARTPDRLKTAFFQLKRVDSQSTVTLQRKQIEDAQKYPDIWRRSFLLGIDAISREACVVLASSVSQFKPRKNTVSVSVSGWEPTYSWTEAWLRCDRGLPSNLRHPGVEALLRAHVKGPAHSLQWLVAGEAEHEIRIAVDTELAGQVVPARAWMVVSMETEAV